MVPSLDLSGRRILVTGASHDSDIGRAICVALAGLGATLVLAGRREDALQATRAELARSDAHVVSPIDLAEIDAIPGWIKQIAADGVLHGIVHAASFQGYSVLRGIDQAAFDRYFHLNVGAAILLGRGLRQKGVAGDGASLVLIGSVAGLRGQKGRTLYAASKAALTAATRSMALELASEKIRVNCVAPAVVHGRRAEEQFALLPAEQRAALDASHPMGYGAPTDVAGAVAFLLAPVSGWITGTTLPVDGGFTAQ
ncbi:MAG: short-chain dehydrogenase [Rhodospirillales bacterium]|nr:short-chain dehydrogenase [Rhodospirillales bacterium]